MCGCTDLSLCLVLPGAHVTADMPGGAVCSGGLLRWRVGMQLLQLCCWQGTLSALACPVHNMTPVDVCAGATWGVGNAEACLASAVKWFPACAGVICTGC
jgi:hypothetical protein